MGPAAAATDDAQTSNQNPAARAGQVDDFPAGRRARFTTYLRNAAACGFARSFFAWMLEWAAVCGRMTGYICFARLWK